MSSREWPERIRDILDAIVETQTFTEGMSLEDFKADAKTVKAVELDFIIIGEAARAVPEAVQKDNPAVPWQIMRSMRNRLVHASFHIDPDIFVEDHQGRTAIAGPTPGRNAE